MKHILPASVLSILCAWCWADEAADKELLERLARNGAASHGMFTAAVMDGWHHNLTACGMSGADDAFFADGNPVQAQIVREMKLHTPDADTAALNRAYRLAYRKGCQEAETLFEPKRCRRFDAESVAQAKKQWLLKLKTSNP